MVTFSDFGNQSYQGYHQEHQHEQNSGYCNWYSTGSQQTGTGSQHVKKTKLSETARLGREKWTRKRLYRENKWTLEERHQKFLKMGAKPKVNKTEKCKQLQFLYVCLHFFSSQHLNFNASFVILPSIRWKIGIDMLRAKSTLKHLKDSNG